MHLLVVAIHLRTGKVPYGHDPATLRITGAFRPLKEISVVHMSQQFPTRSSAEPESASEHATGGLTHFDANGQAHMVDVAPKAPTHRLAVATGCIQMQPDTLALVRAGTAHKGDVLGVARIAGIQAAKKTSDLIPLCHPIALTRVAIEFAADPDTNSVVCQATTETVGVTGVEMEALAAVQVALLTIYDMCKAVDRGMVISGVRLLEKRGGRSGSFVAADQPQG